jgi:hypothetical protein
MRASSCHHALREQRARPDVDFDHVEPPLYLYRNPPSQLRESYNIRHLRLAETRGLISVRLPASTDGVLLQARVARMRVSSALQYIQLRYTQVAVGRHGLLLMTSRSREPSRSAGGALRMTIDIEEGSQGKCPG